MPRRILPPRGLGNLRTWGERGKARMPPYKAYLRISFLELERARHDQEAAAAQQRLATIAARGRDIEAEKQTILAGLSETPPRPGAAELALPARGRGQFKHTY